MRRDVCYSFPVSVERLYNAYLNAASNSKFRRECSQEPYHTLSFGLNFSMKYNFNGGACTLRFMPIQGGSAVNLRFSIAQLAGARYEKYAKDLTDAAASVLGVAGQETNIDVELFLSPANMVTPAASQTYAPQPAPEPIRSSSPSNIACPDCGKALNDGDKFCSGCGKLVIVEKKFCTGCGKEVAVDAAFCSACGKKL